MGGSKIPLIPYAHGGSLAPLATSKTMIYWGATGTGAHPGLLSTNLAIVGTGSAQKHALSVIVGEIRTDEASKQFLQAHGVGTSLISSTGDYYGYHGDIATLDAADGSDFFGLDGPHHAVIVGEDVNNLDVVIGHGINESQRDADTTIFPNIAISSTTNASDLGGMRSTRIMSAYVGGVSRDFDSSGNFIGTHVFHSLDTTGTSNFIQTSAANNTVYGAFRFMRPSGFSHGLPDTTLDFGDLAASEGDDSTFIDDGHFGAIGFDSSSPIEPDIGVARNTDISLAGITPSGVSICTCAYVTWGFWAAGTDPSTEHDIGLATWVAGERFTTPNPGSYTATGRYSGTLIASVANGPHETNGQVANYTAVGSYAFDLTITAGSPGTVSITTNGVGNTATQMTIDGATMNFTGTGSVTANNAIEASGTISGTRGAATLAGSVRASVFGAQASGTSAPPNAAGHFYAYDGTMNYQIGGIHFSQLKP